MAIKGATRRRTFTVAGSCLVVLALLVSLAWMDHHRTEAVVRDSLVGGLPAGGSALVGAAQAAVQLTDAQARGLTSMPWRFVGLRDGGQVLDIVLVAGDGSCVTPAGVTVDESTSRVIVTALSRTDRSQRACPSDLILARDLVTLSSPLGSRGLYHAPVSPQWSSPGYLQ